jgi:hypothetical protein
MPAMMTRMCWSLVELVSRLLERPERDVVRGDLAECEARAGRALREVLGLVVRRQAVAWCDWRPWFTLAGIVIPIGFLLSHASRWWGVHSAVDLANYWVLWDISYLAYPGYRNDVIRMAVWLGAACLALVGWSWTSGFVVGRLSRQTLWLTVSLLLARNGIYLHENLMTADLARDNVYEFVYMFAPLRLKGATGSPGNPIAIR